MDAIALMEMPKKFVFPLMKMYDGTTDPNDHIASYNNECSQPPSLANYVRLVCVRGSDLVW